MAGRDGRLRRNKLAGDEVGNIGQGMRGLRGLPQGMPVHLWSRMVKEATLMWIREYGPSDSEWMWAYPDTFPEWVFPRRVSEALADRGPPPLGCAYCNGVAERRLHRTRDGMIVWLAGCAMCDGFSGLGIDGR